jgi:septum site-determining protein MinC
MGAANRVQGGIFTIMVVKIGDPYDPALEREIAEQVALSPAFFADAPVVIDLKDSLGCTSVADYTSLRQLLRRHGMIPVGVQNASALQLRAAKAVDLSAFSGASSGTAARRPIERALTPAPTPAPLERAADRPAAERSAESRTRLVTQPVRSGTQIYARGGDLVVVAPVSAGAEIIADGHIHVYGALRGRAIAGAAGDITARIFAHRFEAELVSVAGRYIVNDAIPPEHFNQPAQVALIDDQLCIMAGWGGNGRSTVES